MSKHEFLYRLEQGLSGLPKQEVNERLAFYSEMIDDLVEEGLSEEEAVSKIGTVDEIVSQVLTETPITKIAKEKIKSKRKLKTWEIVLLAAGAPLWIVLLAAAFVVILALYVVIWSLAISLWAFFASFVACTPAALALGIISICMGELFKGIAMIGIALVCAGLSIFMFFASRETTRGIALLTKSIVLWIKKLIVGKEKKNENGN